MADILVFNALKDVEASLAVQNGLVITPAEIKTAVDATIAAVNYTNVTNTGFDLTRLSCNQEIASCAKNYAGSGSNGNMGGSPWTELEIVNTDTIYSRLIKHGDMSAIISKINDITSNNLKSNIQQYIEIYAKAAIEKAASVDVKVKYYWLRSSTSKYYSDSMKVCAGSGAYCCGVGATCTWVVPSGTTEAKFQVWGAGSGSNPGCCCSGAPFGANGAYAELTVGVTAGQQYVICAGCACFVCNCSNAAPGYACMSGVTGPNICCLKADGACHNNCLALDYAKCCLAGLSPCYRFQNAYCTSSGPCWCSYGEYCYGGSSCATCGVVPVHADCNSGRTWCACGTNTTQVSKYGMYPIHGGGCLDTSHYGYMTRPPILDADTCKAYVGGCCCHTFTSESCSGGYLGNCWTRHPGTGGAATHVMGGANNHFGSVGAGGMVKVSWK